MKRISILIPVIAGLMIMLMSGCDKPENRTPASYSSSATATPTPADDGKLSTAKAQNALNRWMTSGGQVTVQGIQEFTKENAAKADITFTNFSYKSNEGLGESQKNYSGPAAAVFTHYNDGRWILTRITIDRGFLDSVSWNNLNVEAR